MDAFLRGLFGLNHQHQQGDHLLPQEEQDHGHHHHRARGGVVAGAAVAAAAASAGIVIPAPAVPAVATAALAAVDSMGVEEEASSWMMLDDENERKRSRSSSSNEEGTGTTQGIEDGSGSGCGGSSARTTSGGARTPGLVLSPRRRGDSDEDGDEDDDDQRRPIKRFRGERSVIPVSPLAHSRKNKADAPVSPLQLLPDDMLAHCLSFLGGVGDRFSLQATSKKFRALSNSDGMRKNIQVGGDRQSGLHGIIREHDTPESASKNLDPYVQAGNLEAIYMLGIIKSYCHQDVEAGIHLLKYASSKGYTRASYALGLALRDGQPEVATMYMQDAADKGYIPALQEILPSRKMKAKYGEPKADELRLHLDPLCLNRLLSRYYVQSAVLREANTSHCWNPLCGRWAFKATAATLAANTSAMAPPHHHYHLRPEASGRRASDSSSTNGLSEPESPTSVAASSLLSLSAAAAAPLPSSPAKDVRVSRMKMCSRCCRAKYCSKLCQVYDWRSGRHKMECQFL